MARADEVRLRYIAELRDFEARLKTMGPITDKNVKEAVKVYSRGMTAIQKATDAAARGNVGKTKAISEGITAIGNAAKIVSPQLGALGERLAGAARGWGAVGGAVGLGAGAVVALGAGLGMAVSGMVKLEQAAAAYIKDVEKLNAAGFALVSADEASRVKAAGTAMDALKYATEGVAVTLASSYAPQVERIAVLTIASTMALQDWIRAVAAGGTVAQRVADSALQALVNSLSAFIPGGSFVAAAAGALGVTDNLTGSIAELADEALVGLESSVEDYLPRAQALIAATATATKETEKNTKAVKEQIKAYELGADPAEALAKIRFDAETAMLGPMDALLQRQDLELANALSLVAATGDIAGAKQALAALEMRQAQEVADLQERLDNEALDRQKAAAAEAQRIAWQERDVKIGAAQNVLSGIEMVASEISASNREGAREAFRISQASAIVQIAISTAAAIMKGYEQLGPILGSIAAVGLGIVGGAQAGIVASQSPPQFYVGTPMTSADTYGATLHRGEAVVPRADVQAAGGPEGVRERVRGNGAGLYEMRVDGRVLGAVTARQLRRGGRLTDEVARHVGRLGRSDS